MENYKYDIFISYKHEALDKAVAARLQKSLEHYKIPKEIQKKTGKEKIKRVFRDEEELAVSSDLGKEIEGQIAQSEYLLVVCSKKTKESQWVLKEIDTFLKYRDAEHILPVLIEGEPEESFPESILVYGEPMAADVRGKNEKEVLKKVKKELPRLIAPILHCSYDELKQRARNYQIKRMLIGTSVALVAVASFAAYAVFQSARLNKEYQETRRNQARNMAQISGRLLKQGDRMGALKTALAIQPENKNSKEALVPEQMGALNDALYTYVTEKTFKFHPIRAEYTEAEPEIGRIQWSPNKKCYMALDRIGYVYLFDGKTGKCIWKEFGDNLKEKSHGFYAATFINDNTIALLSGQKILIVDIKEKSLDNAIALGFSLEDKFDNYDLEMLYDKGKLFICESSSFWVYDLKDTGKNFVIQGEDLDKEQHYMTEIVCTDDGFIIIGTAEGLFTYSMQTGKVKKISNQFIHEIRIIDDKYIAVMQATEILRFNVYNYHNGYKVYNKNMVHIDEGMYGGCSIYEMKVNKNKEKVVIFYFGDTVYCFSMKKFELINKKRYSTYIIGIEKYNDTQILVGTVDGNIYVYFDPFRTDLVERTGFMYVSKGKIELQDEYVQYFSYSDATKRAVQQIMDSNMIIMSGSVKDSKVCKFPTNKKIEYVRYFSVKEGRKKKSYRCILYEEDSDGKCTVEIYQVGKSEIVYQKKCSNMYQSDLNNWYIGQIGKHIVLYYIEADENEENSILHIVNLNTKQEVKTYVIDKYKYSKPVVGYSSNSSCIWVKEEVEGVIEGYRVKQINISEDLEISVRSEKNSQSYNEIEKICVSPTNRYLLVAYSDYLKIWDVKNKNWRKVNKNQKIEGVLTPYDAEYPVKFGETSNKIAICKENNIIEIINIDDNSTEKISLGNNIGRNLGNNIEFFDNDQYVIVLEDGFQVSMWNLKEEKKVMQQKITEVIDGKIKIGKSYFAVEDSARGIRIFTVDENHRFSLYADINDGWVDFNSKEIFIEKWEKNKAYISKLYNFQELKKEALKVLDGETLTKEEKRKYFLEE